MDEIKEKKLIFRELIDFGEYYYSNDAFTIRAAWQEGIWRLSYREGTEISWTLFCETPRQVVETLWEILHPKVS